MGISLVYITDQNYVMPALVSITSAIKNKSSNYKIYLITTFEASGTIACINSLNDTTAEIVIILVDIKKLIPQHINAFNHVTSTALIKFFLPEILSSEDKVLYLDGDTIIQKPLDELYNTELEDNYAGVVSDSALYAMPQHTEHLQIEPEKYFNSGVMLLNLKKMREARLTNKLLEYKTNQYNYFMDQDAFNKILYNRVVFLPEKYNMIPLNKTKKQIKEAAILHFAVKLKPWIYNTGLVSKIFKKYYNLSPYKKIKLKLKNNNQLIKFLHAVIKQNL